MERKEIPLFDEEAFREAMINAFVHNQWTTGNAPMITAFSDRIEILSRGTIPPGQTMEGFFAGESVPVNQKLSDMLLQLHISERTGRGVPKITEVYGKGTYEFRENSIVVSIPFTRVSTEDEDPRWTQDRTQDRTQDGTQEDVVYIGTLAQGKRTTVSHKVKKEIAVPECDWVVVENAHEAIISRMDFDAVQILMSRDTIAVAGKNESYMYAGILYCGDCGSSMVHRKESYKGREYINYICSNYNRNGKDACSRHCIREEDLNQIVLGELQGYINSMCDCEKVLAHLDELNVNYDEAVAHDKEIVALKQELTKCSAFKASLYQDLRDEIISKEQFTRYREEFSAKERELEQAIREQETIIRNIYENGIVVAKDLEQFREGLVIGNLDRVALVSFIDRILIYDDFRVEIVFKYRQEMEKVTGLFDVVNEKDAEPVYTMVDGLPVLELKEAV